MSNVPAGFEGSAAMQFIISRGWNWKTATPPNIELENCPYCSKGWGHFYMEVHGIDSEHSNRDGLYQCFKCGKTGRLVNLKEFLGVSIPGVESKKDWAGDHIKREKLPDIDESHSALLSDTAAMDYLVNVRGFSTDIIKKCKLGIVPERYFREAGNVKALVYPYLVNNNMVFVHYRTLPDPKNLGKIPKAFSSPMGWDAPLYNGEILREGLKEVIFVEGEANCIASLDKGIENICGVPGANFKKAEWITTLDDLNIEKVYICYDKDNAGQKAAQEIAKRIGIEKCWKIDLPDFEVTTEFGEKRKGKDLNEWFTVGGGTTDKFKELMTKAALFDVEGVSDSKTALQELWDEIEGKHSIEGKYKTQFSDLNKLVTFDTGDVIDIIAEEKMGKSTFTLNLLDHMVETYGEDGIFICAEMTRVKLARKWVCYKAQIADNIPNNPEESNALLQEFLTKIPQVQEMAASSPGELYFCSPHYKTEEDIYQLIRDVIRRYGVKWIVIDNLQRIIDTTPSNNRQNRTERMSAFSKVLSQFAKDYGVQIIRILQPHRVLQGQIATSSNNDGSSQVAKDCDCNLALHRQRLNDNKAENVEKESGTTVKESFSDNTALTVGLSRYSSGGRTWLLFDGARSTFLSSNPVTQAQNEAAKAEMSKDKFSEQVTAAVKPKDDDPKEAITI
jgi:replicative DNA helicase/5S rRNA maturation endonuclease (ribonuclease M5)